MCISSKRKRWERKRKEQYGKQTNIKNTNHTDIFFLDEIFCFAEYSTLTLLYSALTEQSAKKKGPLCGVAGCNIDSALLATLVY
jgi:hypothetical protein